MCVCVCVCVCVCTGADLRQCTVATVTYASWGRGAPPTKGGHVAGCVTPWRPCPADRRVTPAARWSDSESRCTYYVVHCSTYLKLKDLRLHHALRGTGSFKPPASGSGSGSGGFGNGVTHCLASTPTGTLWHARAHTHREWHAWHATAPPVALAGTGPVPVAVSVCMRTHTPPTPSTSSPAYGTVLPPLLLLPPCRS